MESASFLMAPIISSSLLRLIALMSCSVSILRLFVKGKALTFIVIPLAKSNALSVRDKALPGSNSGDRSFSERTKQNKHFENN